MESKLVGKSDPLVVLLHGGPSLFGYMRSLGKLLESDFEVLDYAQRGTFENPTATESITLDQLVEDLYSSVSSSGRPVVVVGHSWGAVLALLFASKYPGVVRKFVLVGTGVMDRAIGDSFSENLRARLGVVERREVESLELACEKTENAAEKQTLMQRWLDVCTPFYNLDRSSTKGLSPSRWNFQTFGIVNSQIWELIENEKIPKILTRIKEPVVAFHGTHDPIPCDLTARFFSAHLSKVQFIRVDRAGHFIWLEPDAKDSFLSKLKDAIRTL